MLLGIAPWYREDWALENALAMVGVLALVLSARRMPLSRASYTLVFAFPMLHELGARIASSPRGRGSFTRRLSAQSRWKSRSSARWIAAVTPSAITAPSASLAMSLLVSTVLMATLVVGPFYLSVALGLDAALVGAVLSVGPLVTASSGVPRGSSASCSEATALPHSFPGICLAGSSTERPVFVERLILGRI